MIMQKIAKGIAGLLYIVCSIVFTGEVHLNFSKSYFVLAWLVVIFSLYKQVS